VHCPKPTKVSEKWRYEKINGCLKAINQSPVDSEPSLNYNLKQSYEQCLNDAMEDVSKELGRVASMDVDEKQRMLDLVGKAAKVWLEFGQQHICSCRNRAPSLHGVDKPLSVQMECKNL
jgi:hypothetical protein